MTNDPAPVFKRREFTVYGPRLNNMSCPESPIQQDGPGFYWAQQYFSETEEMTPPILVNLYVDKSDGNKMKCAWLDAGAPLRIPDRWIWLEKLKAPEGLVAVLD